MTWSMGVALVVTIGAIAALIKRYETRLVLLSAGIFDGSAFARADDCF